MPLDGDEFRPAFFFRQGVCLRQLPGVAVGDADVTRFACFHHAIQTIQNIFNRRLPVPHVIDIQVHMIHTQVLQARVDHAFNVRLSVDAGFNLVLRAGEEFGGHHHFVPPGKVPQGPAHILLAGAALIGDSGIVEVDA